MEGVEEGKSPTRWMVREIGIEGRERERERERGRRESGFLIDGGRVRNGSFDACGSVRDCSVRNESRPIIGAPPITVAVSTNSNSVRVVDDDMVVGFV